MAKRTPQQIPQEGSANDWMNTYCDMVTLLFAFFVILFAASEIDATRWNLLVSSLNNRGVTTDVIREAGFEDAELMDTNTPRIPLPVGPTPMQPTLHEAFEMIEDHIFANDMQEQVITILGDDYIFIRFVDDMLFEPNSARIRPQDFELLNFIGMALQTIQDDVGMIRIDGHTAAIPEVTNYHVSDRLLSSERANAVLMYFEDVVGIRGDRLTALSFGKQHPIGDNFTEEGRRANRRIELMITEANALSTQLDSIYERMFE